jgi:predicted enzyme related to lactoylglutathione lyase
MSEQMMPPQGAFCWNELATTDLDAAQNFYRTLLGWEIKEGTAPGGGMRYSEIVVGGRHVGGMYSTAEMCGGAEGGEGAQQQQQQPPHWMSYVAVDDVDASAAKAKELGGKVCVEPMDIPGVGRFCVVNDPAGATISLITLKGANS